MTQLDYNVRDRIAVITFANPPVNSINTEFVVKTIAVLERAAADAAVDGVVLTGQGGSFSAGADIKEFATALRTAPTPASKWRNRRCCSWASRHQMCP